ncbi:hypothetical protein C8R43DRAFT_965132 [Mycena crocata]|nr:hypothetical protein C8R43DRAFT_965132 [Mycena crocata]
MPQTTQTHLENTITCLAGPVNCLKILAESSQSPFLAPISNTAESLIAALESVQQNKKECLQLMEKTHGLLYAITTLNMKSECDSELPLITLANLAKFIETLHKIHTYVEAQQSKSKIRQFFRQGEMSALLKDCKTEIQEALDTFEVENVMLTGLADMKKYAENKHSEVLELIEAMSEGSVSEKGSLLQLNFYAAF